MLSVVERRRQGRKTYFGLTPHAVQVLTDGRDRIWRTGAVNRDWDGRWTMVGFSLPEAWSRERHDLRSRLMKALERKMAAMVTAPARAA